MTDIAIAHHRFQKSKALDPPDFLLLAVALELKADGILSNDKAFYQTDAVRKLLETTRQYVIFLDHHKYDISKDLEELPGNLLRPCSEQSQQSFLARVFCCNCEKLPDPADDIGRVHFDFYHRGKQRDDAKHLIRYKHTTSVGSFRTVAARSSASHGDIITIIGRCITKDLPIVRIEFDGKESSRFDESEWTEVLSHASNKIEKSGSFLRILHVSEVIACVHAFSAQWLPSLKEFEGARNGLLADLSRSTLEATATVTQLLRAIIGKCKKEASETPASNAALADALRSYENWETELRTWRRAHPWQEYPYDGNEVRDWIQAVRLCSELSPADRTRYLPAVLRVLTLWREASADWQNMHEWCDIPFPMEQPRSKNRFVVLSVEIDPAYLLPDGDVARVGDRVFLGRVAHEHTSTSEALSQE